ncbi:hypothetical protein Q4520_14540 [Alteromonas sp. 1_MG-2023]|uniref:hypothetical protein n=1 Tax=Alteromonas sp. 1_MG-2023 TaxID=3062669 RepID=UPI0026E38AC1|nr:hypothetical protein [Alteromonas sp. 1_MG-2023]MDO6476647.1 hypothetical protein [Alteromonas sp. 1_MG-2023]
MKMNVLPATLVFASLALSASAHADVADYMKAAGAFCDKLKVCISLEMEKEMGGEVPPQMRGMVEGMADQMCQQYVPEMFEEKFAAHEDIVEKSTECLNEMLDIDCSDFEDLNEPASCKEAESMAKARGLIE